MEYGYGGCFGYAAPGDSGPVWASGLTHEWLCDEDGATPGNIIDSVGTADLTEIGTLGNHNDATFGYVRDNLSKIGTGEVAKSEVAELYGGADFSISFWCWHNAAVSDSLMGTSDGAGDECWYLRRMSSGSFRLYASADGTATVNGSFGTSSIQTWYHVVLTWDESGEEFEVFLDGVSQGTESVVGGLFNAIGPFALFADHASDEFEGRLSTVRTWNLKLSQSIITALSNEYSP